MPELIGDIVIPKELILNNDPSSSKTLSQSGAYLFASGASVFAIVGSTVMQLG